MRILGKGKTAQAIQEVYPDADMFDDSDKDIYDINSDELTIVSPGIPPYNYLVKNTRNKQSDYDLFITKEKFSIWISGTNGKTTTTQMIYLLLKNSGFECGGNIGTPLASLKESKKLILETSSFTLHYTNKAKPNIYILLPISDDHLSWHGTFEEYKNSKLKPLLSMGKNDIAVIPYVYKDIQTEALVYYYNNSRDLADQFNIDIDRIKFKEPFLIDSILALVTYKLVTKDIDYTIINSFKVDQHKVEEFYDNQNRLWIDDSKATNIDATIWALKGYAHKKIYLILGGDDKGSDLTPLFKELKKYTIECFFIGKNKSRLESLAKEYKIAYYIVDTLEKSIEKIDSLYNNKNSVAMLSPAAASLDQFTSYKDRGEKFKKFVKSL